MSVFKSLDSKVLRIYSLGTGIIGTAFFCAGFIGYFLIHKLYGTVDNQSSLNLHCMFMIVLTFFQTCACILLIVGAIKQSHQEIRVWLILSPICWLLMVVTLLSMLKYIEVTSIDTRYVPVVIACVLNYLISYDLIYSYYVNRRTFAYEYLQEYSYSVR